MVIPRKGTNTDHSLSKAVHTSLITRNDYEMTTQNNSSSKAEQTNEHFTAKRRIIATETQYMAFRKRWLWHISPKVHLHTKL